jgi:tRNA(fMet)-specific endonuclease VapC
LIYLLDTNALIHAQRGKPPAVRAKLREISPDDLAVSTVTLAELWFGIAKSSNPAGKRAAWERVIEPWHILAFDEGAADLHARIRWDLRHKPIGDRDLLIAAIAASRNLVVVSQNVREFQRVPDLRVEDWT